MLRSRNVAVATALLIALAATAVSDVLRVAADAAPGGDGTSWATAFARLQDALAVASAGDEVWVAQGTYFAPDFDSFHLPSNVAVYGGFLGSEQFRDERPAGTRSTLTGLDFAIVAVANTVADTMLERLTLSGGACIFGPGGGAVYVENGHLRLVDCQLVGNQTVGSVFPDQPVMPGGALLAVSSTIEAERCAFLGNLAGDGLGDPGSQRGGSGGAVALIGTADNPAVGHFRSCQFEDNRAGDGGSTYVNPRDGGVGGAIYASYTELDLTDCQFSNNRSGRGGLAWALQDQDGWGGDGGAVLLSDGSLTATGCAFVGNYTGGGFDSGRGGATRTTNATVALVNCIYRDNYTGSAGGLDVPGKTGDGGGLMAVGGSFTARNLRLVGNHTGGESGGAVADAGHGGAMYLGGMATPAQLVNCLFNGNWTAETPGLVDGGDGSAIAMTANVIMTNCTVVNNFVSDSFPGGRGAVAVRSGSLLLVNGIVWGNTDPTSSIYEQNIWGIAPRTVNFSCVEGWTPAHGGVGNTGADPLLYDIDGLDDIAGNADDQLDPLPLSPCVDAGDNTAVPPDLVADLDGGLRFLDVPGAPDVGVGPAPIVDMGAFETSPCSADLNGDGFTDFVDFAMLAGGWGPGSTSGDINRDGDTSFADFDALAADWGCGM